MANFTIPESYVKQFSDAVHMLAEQDGSRLLNAVETETVTGESFAVERLGGIDRAQEVADLFGDTPINPLPHSRRWGFITTYDVADAISKASEVALLIQPKNRYARRHAATMNRTMDDAILAALTGTAKAGKNATTDVALPSEQKIAVGSGAAARLTVDKLRRAKRLLDEKEVDPSYPRYFAANAAMMEQLLQDPLVTSQDFNTVRALVRGEVDTYMGFNFIRTERLRTITGNVRAAVAWAQPAVRFGLAQPMQSLAAERPDKRHAWQIYTHSSFGAVRVEDEMVVEVAADITAVPA